MITATQSHASRIFVPGWYEVLLEKTVNRKPAPRGLMIILATLLILSMAVAARAEDSSCSYSRAAGDWIITDSGTVFVPEKNGTSVGVPRAAFGKVTLDSGGNLVKGVATSSLNGVIADETFHGTYTVNPDSCMGTITAFIFSSGSELFTVTLDIVFDKKMDHMNGIFRSVVPPGSTDSLPTVVAFEARRQ